MTTTMPEVDEELDLSDLDLLDEMGRHWACTDCFPGPFNDPFQTFTALCGKTAIVGSAPMAYVPEAGDCPVCVAKIDQPCSRCGQ